MTRKTIKLPDDLQNIPQHMLNEANTWYVASRRCHESIPLSPNISNSLLHPTIVCNAFSIEMYLKSLLVISKISPNKEHRLGSLFQLLPMDVRDKASARFADYWTYSDNDLVQYLSETSEWFVSFRYIFEPIAHFMVTGTPSALRAGEPRTRIWPCGFRFNREQHDGYQGQKSFTNVE